MDAICPSKNGAEALELAQSHGEKIDLLLTDVVMPKIGGKELSEYMRPIFPGIRVLFISGYPDVSIGHGVQDTTCFLQKPFTVESLGKN